jgi:formylglycine-generating enzyme required for sulfatase activity
MTTKKYKLDLKSLLSMIVILFITINLYPESKKKDDISKIREELNELKKEVKELRYELFQLYPDRFSEPEEETVEVTPPTGKTYKNSLGIEFVKIPSGEFMMGCVKGDSECEDSEKPQHKIKISQSFYMGKFEVTQGEWKKVMDSNPSNFSNCGDNCPVEQVSWDDTQEFIGKLCKREKQNPCKYRLPTEAEWEYSARAGSKTKYYWGETINDAYLWYDGNSGGVTHPVGKKKPNAWGLYDMCGNVWEWTNDWYDGDYYKNSPSKDPKGPADGQFRVLRGGSWGDYASSSRLSYRSRSNPDRRLYDIGFRLVLLP